MIRVALVGIGNCARALVEGISYYRGSGLTTGLMHPRIGPYAVDDIEPVLGFDVDNDKVGLSVWDAREGGQNLLVGITPFQSVPVGAGAPVLRGPTLDGIGSRYAEKMTLAPDRPDLDGAYQLQALKENKVQVIVNYLPVGSQEATEWWAGLALEAGCAFVNCIPVFIARRDYWRDRFREAELPLLGDDIKSQYGATFVHRALVKGLADRGIRLDRTYQLNAGGNMDFWNMLEQDRLATKRESKTSAVTDAYDGDLDPANVHIGPSDYVEWLGDRKRAFVRVEASGFGGTRLELDLNLDVPDSPNSAGVVVDAVRLAAMAMDEGEPLVDEWASAWLFKAPPRSVALLSDDEARTRLQAWLEAKVVASP